MKQSSFLVVLVVLSLLLLGACQPQQTIIYHTGTQGLTLTFAKDVPPKTVYEDSIVPLVVTLANKGAWDVNYADIVFSVKGDPFYVNVTNDDTYHFADPYRWAEERGAYGPPPPPDQSMLHGKSPSWETGEWIDLHPTAEFKPILGLREQPTTQLFASACYAYGTVLGTSLCVDANAFNGNVQKQVCGAETLTFKDQGAPVAITGIENRPSPLRLSDGTASRDLVQPVFIIHIQNVGDGAVLMPAAKSADDLVTSCSHGVTANPAVAINATLSSLQLNCKPNPVPLMKDEGYTTCVLPASASGTFSAPNYLAAFKAELHYIYRSSLSTDVTIQRLPGGIGTAASGTEANPAYIEGKTRCEFCSGNRNDPRCSDWPPKANQTAAFSCACSQQECTQLAQHAPAVCVFGETWCPGTSYCCIPSAR
jgi:hypothetical protein